MKEQFIPKNASKFRGMHWVKSYSKKFVLASMPASPQVNGGAPSSSGRGGGGGFGGSRGGFGGGGGRGYGAYSRDSNMIGKKVTLKSGHFR